MTAPPTSIVPVTMRKTDGAAPRDPVRPIASWRANHDPAVLIDRSYRRARPAIGLDAPR